MGSIVKSILDFRINIDAELQGWILLFATVTAVFFFCLPCYCAGLSCDFARRLARWLQQRLPAFYLGMAVFNTLFISFITRMLPDWTFSNYMKILLTTVVKTIQSTMECASSIAVIAIFCFLVAFKERIALLFGIDHKTLFRFKFRDCLSCWGSQRFRPIEVAVWKVEDLPSADLFSANNIFVELFLGYNEPMKTRVHNNAGSGCLVKENIHLNFDEDDDEDTLFIFVKNQKVMGTAELARAEISSERLKDMVHESEKSGGWSEQRWQWSDRIFGEPITLIPRGKIWLQARAIHDADYDHNFMQDLTTC